MEDKKNPFISYTLDQVRNAEASLYVIQVGNDLYCHGKSHSYSKRTAQRYFNKILSSLIYTVENGTDDEKDDALRFIRTLRIMPLRIN